MKYCNYKDGLCECDLNGRYPECPCSEKIADLAIAKRIPLADRKPDQVNSMRKLNKALKQERILGGGKVI